MANTYSNVIYDTTSSHGYWNAQTVNSGTTFNTAADSSWGYSRLSLIFGRAQPSGGREDNMQIDFSIALNAGGGLISSLSSTDMANAEADVDTWFTTMKTRLVNEVTLLRYDWRHLNGYGHKFTPIARTTTKNVVGTDASVSIPYQDAETCTFRTASRRHWGRIYFPGLTTAWLTNNGLLSTSACVALLNATDTLKGSLESHAGSLLLGVGSSKFYGFLTLIQMEVDNVPDIQRRRRPNKGTLFSFKP